MKRLWVLFGVLLAVAGSPRVWADGIPQIVDTTTTARWTRTVYNNSGSALTSGTVVIWQTGNVNFDRSGYPYVTTTTTADSIWVAGVTLNPSCADTTLCEIVVYGPVIGRFARSTDTATAGQLVGTTTVAGQYGDYVPAANTCALGRFMEDRNQDAGGACNASFDNCPAWVFVDPACQ